jgi:hypothetical protein
LIAGAVCVGAAVEVLLVLLLTTVLSVDDVLVRVRAATDDVEVLDLRDELVSFELVDDFVEDEDDDFVLLEVLTDFDVDVLVEEGLTELVVDVFDVVEVCTDVELDEVLTVTVPILYISRRFPAPQYSNSFPGQTIEQSLAAARTEPVLMTLPQ